ncbi:MAG TPA: heterodisulfide reductase-related iron-sulfur binding cluster [Oligoflexia bacterium]|nr:heterodisulfide reductase-related iron-sulfur binding cluster [Oligoflexia bacterium]HMP27868.1 heterodisulfide reductase-related iron-sulfur binding cluster [Oligoflexia bacterium]
MNEASREIMWNAGGPWASPLMYLLMTIALIIGFNGALARCGLIVGGRPTEKNFAANFFKKFLALFTEAGLQTGVTKERKGGFAHLLIYLGFLVLLFTTTMVFIDHDLGFKIYRGDFYLAVTILSDLFGVALLIGVALMAKRRYLDRETKLHNLAADSIALWVLALLVIQGYLLEGLRIKVTGDPWALYSPVGLAVAKFFWNLSDQSARFLHFLTWWFHTVTVFAVAAIFPYSKFWHLFSSSANLFLKPLRGNRAALNSPGDLEKMLESDPDTFTIGRGSIKDYTWKELFDLEACTSCGRCQEVCPAHLSGKPLSPKWLILDSRNHLLALKASEKLDSKLPHFKKLDNRLTKWFLQTSGLTSANNSDPQLVYENNGAFRSNNQAVQTSVLKIGASADQLVAGEVISADVFWSCTTCMACVEACPVGINHVDQIVENRRHLSLIRGELPSEAQSSLRSIETRGNPFAAPEDRIKWLKEISIKILRPGDEVDYLYWVGCVSAYDQRKQKIARALVKIMEKANLSFGVLGELEGCSGDPARRLGEENLFQSMAKKNIELLKSVRFKYLVANCPHCFNTIRNEYPQFGNLSDGAKPEIIHHSQLINKLIKENKITLSESQESFTMHDPCYLGRYNNEYEAPRASLRAARGLKIIEMPRAKEKGLCCGAGGGHYWMDLKIGERVNSIRALEAVETGAKNVATACPFCMQMLEDGIKLNQLEDKLTVRDIAEFVAEQIES